VQVSLGYVILTVYLLIARCATPTTTIARAMVDRFLATATYVALAKRIDLPAAFEPKMVFELSVGNRPA
jgi:hypothetical protein